MALRAPVAPSRNASQRLKLGNGVVRLVAGERAGPVHVGARAQATGLLCPAPDPILRGVDIHATAERVRVL
jgi:hypothetical protein